MARGQVGLVPNDLVAPHLTQRDAITLVLESVVKTRAAETTRLQVGTVGHQQYRPLQPPWIGQYRALDRGLQNVSANPRRVGHYDLISRNSRRRDVHEHVPAG